ncbi:conjugal transfer protein [Massilia sp.]|uniref:conjugal transfer protein n=1 Tax=Massilia sp. TaxID=1882437 RepID=UPI00352E33DF
MRAIVAGLLLMIPLVVGAEDLGARGRTVPVDRDAREQMKDVIRRKEANGDVDRFWSNYRAKVIDAVKHPAPLGVPTDARVRTELHELRFVMPQDYVDQIGRVVVRRGTVIEPLKIQPLATGLIFIDGRDEAQIQYALAASQRERLKIVLTAGSPYDLRVRFKDTMWNGTPTVPFYFDQRKQIINTLQRLYGINLRSVPAKLTQKDSRLQIEFGIRK